MSGVIMSVGLITSQNFLLSLQLFVMSVDRRKRSPIMCHFASLSTLLHSVYLHVHVQRTILIKHC